MKPTHAHLIIPGALAALCLFATPAAAQDSPPRGGAPRQGAPSGEHRGPPPEALAACRGLSRGATCIVTPPGGSAVRGTCDSPSEDLPLACRPEGGPGGRGGPGHHGPPPAALEACEDTAVGDACVLDTPRGTVEGVCRSMPDGRTACAPNRPPPSRSTP